MTTERFIKVRVRSGCSRKEYQNWRVNLPGRSFDYGRYVRVAVTDIVRQESIYWNLRPEPLSLNARLSGIQPKCRWEQLTSPLPDIDSEYSCHCLITLSDSVIVTEESFAQIEQRIIEATNRK